MNEGQYRPAAIDVNWEMENIKQLEMCVNKSTMIPAAVDVC